MPPKKSFSKKGPSTAILAKMKAQLRAQKKLEDEQKRFEEEVIRLSSELISLIKKNNLDEKDFSFGHSGIFGFILKNSKGEIKYPSKRIISCLNNPEKWVVKNYSKWFLLSKRNSISISISN